MVRNIGCNILKSPPDPLCWWSFHDTATAALFRPGRFSDCSPDAYRRGPALILSLCGFLLSFLPCYRGCFLSIRCHLGLDLHATIELMLSNTALTSGVSFLLDGVKDTS